MHAILTTKKRFVFIGVAMALMGLVLNTGQVSAQAADVTPDDQAEKIVEEFDTYTAVEGDNITTLVRRSIVEYAQANNDVELSDAQIVFAETKIVQELMCDDTLHVGQEVSVSLSKVMSYTAESQNLTDTETANWSTYANNANFVLGDRTVQSNSGSSTTNLGTGSGAAEDDESETAENGANGDDDEVSDNSTAGDSDDGDSSSSLWWWLAGGGAVLAGWHLLGKQRK